MINKLTLPKCVEDIESSYEFMLAYAAQGRDKEGVGADGPSIRHCLGILSHALKELDAAIKLKVDVLELSQSEPINSFVKLIKDDARRGDCVVTVVLAAPVISSQLIDNLNASIHLRALLTSLFIIDECLK
jgi:hypothetical protein